MYRERQNKYNLLAVEVTLPMQTTTMTGRERVKAILQGKPVDRCAYWTGNPHQESWPALFAYFGCATPEALYQRLGDDVRWIPVGGQALTPFGCYAACETAEQVEEAFTWPDPELIDFTRWLTALQQAEGYYRLSGNLSMFFHDTCFNGFGGMQEYLLRMYTHPEVVHAVTRLANDYYLRLNRRFFQLAGEGMEAYKISHDLGAQRGLLISPAMLDEFVYPYLQAQIDLGHEFGYEVLLHCCGAIQPILPRLIAMGVDLLHPIQALAAGMTPEELAPYRRQVAFIGGVDTQQLLIHGTPEMIEETVHHLAATLGPLVISPSHEAVLPDIPPANLLALAQAVRRVTCVE